MTLTPLTCSKCGGPIPPGLDPMAALSEEEIASLPPAMLRNVQVLCQACANPSPPSHLDPTQTPMSEGQRNYQLTLTIQDQASEADEWEDVGRFTLRGTASSVAEFMEGQNEEFNRRLGVILGFA